MVKEAPSALTIISPEKRRIMSELVVTRNTIKKKFQQAYADRQKLERVTKEIFKPITSSITTLKISEKKEEEENKKKKMKKKNARKRLFDNDLSDFELSDGMIEARPFKPLKTKLFSNTDDQKAHRKHETFHSMNDLSDLYPYSSYSKSSSKVSPDPLLSAKTSRTNSPKLSSSQKTPSQPPSEMVNTSPSSVKSAKVSPAQTRSRFQQTGNIDAERNSYEVCGDNDDRQNYNSYPDDDVIVQCIETSNLSGKTTRKDVAFKFLPSYAKRKWVEDRKLMVAPLSDADNGTGAVKKRVKKGKGMKSINFDFIPYKSNSRIIYEYFDDPNELCERLRLLISSRMAGNTNHMQEINSIIEELREIGCIA